MIDDLLKSADDRMAKAVESTRGEFGSVRTGRATPALLDRVTVDYYGTSTPLNQVATISAPEARLLTVQPYDVSALDDIERGIVNADLGITPGNDGKIIRIAIPELTEERRKEMVKLTRSIAEEGRIRIRNIRRDVMHELRELKDGGEVGSDEEHRGEEALQKLTDERIGELEDFLARKEAEILEV